MKTFSASQLSHTPALVFAEARANGAIIQQKRTNGEVSEEFVLLPFKAVHDQDKGEIVAFDVDGRHALKP